MIPAGFIRGNQLPQELVRCFGGRHFLIQLQCAVHILQCVVGVFKEADDIPVFVCLIGVEHLLRRVFEAGRQVARCCRSLEGDAGLGQVGGSRQYHLVLRVGGLQILVGTRRVHVVQHPGVLARVGFREAEHGGSRLGTRGGETAVVPVPRQIASLMALEIELVFVNLLQAPHHG